jgi:hypothetical protein
MTFEKFFSLSYKDVPGVDRNTAAIFRAGARDAFKACWNSALDAASTAAGPEVLTAAHERIRALKVE